MNILISGYLEPFRNDRNCFGGGVLIYIADYLHASRRYDLEFINGELIWIEVSFPRYKIHVCVVYRSKMSITIFLNFSERAQVLV
jgi:hypothetical protein